MCVIDMYLGKAGVGGTEKAQVSMTWPPEESMILIDWPTRSRCIANPRAGMVVILLATFKKRVFDSKLFEKEANRIKLLA